MLRQPLFAGKQFLLQLRPRPLLKKILLIGLDLFQLSEDNPDKGFSRCLCQTLDLKSQQFNCHVQKIQIRVEVTLSESSHTVFSCSFSLLNSLIKRNDTQIHVLLSVHHVVVE